MKEGLQPRCNTWGETARGSLPMNKFIPLHKQDHTIFCFIVQPLCLISSWILKKNEWSMNSIVDSKKHRGMRNALIIFEHLLCLSRRSWITKLSRNWTQIDSPSEMSLSSHISWESNFPNFDQNFSIFVLRGRSKLIVWWGRVGRMKDFDLVTIKYTCPPPPTRLRLHRILIIAPHWQSQANFAQLLYRFFSKSRE